MWKVGVGRVRDRNGGGMGTTVIEQLKNNGSGLKMERIQRGML